MSGQSIHRLTLSGDLTVRSAALIHAQLTDALDRHDAVEIDCTEATAVDLSFIQLLMATRRGAAATGATLKLRHPVGGPLHDAVLRAGVIEGDVSRAFWLGMQEGHA